MDRKEAIEIVREYYPSSGKDLNEALETLIPELKESEDERVRKHLVKHFQNKTKEDWNGMPVKDILAWLEKQGEQKSDAKVEPKFKIGDTIHKIGENTIFPMVIEEITEEDYVCDNKQVFISIKFQEQYELVKQESDDKVKAKQNSDLEKGKWYVCDTPRYKDFIVGKAYYCPKNEMLKSYEDDLPRYVAKHCFHPWTIQDAKDGDILCTYECDNPKIVFILKGTPKKHYALGYHCYYNVMHPHFEFDSESGCLAPNDEDVKPATKEQREFLFKKMKEAGYEWGAEKKELKKIDQNPAWSEEDEDMVDNIIKAIHHLLKENDSWGFLEDCLDWLKSLKERYTWKPSDKQMGSITCAVRKMKESYCYDSELVSLLNDLKKLKG